MFFHSHRANFRKRHFCLWNFRMFLLKGKLSLIYLCIHRHKKVHRLFASVPWTSLCWGTNGWFVVLTSTRLSQVPNSCPGPLICYNSSVLLLPVVGGASLSFPERNEHNSRHSWRNEGLLDSLHRELPNRETSEVPGWLRAHTGI